MDPNTFHASFSIFKSHHANLSLISFMNKLIKKLHIVANPFFILRKTVTQILPFITIYIMSFIKRLNDQFKQTTVHGLSHFAKNTNNNFKIYWIIMTLTCLSGMIYFISIRFRDYFLATVTVSIDQNKEDILRFPIITICSLNNMDDVDNDFSYYTIKEVLAAHLIKKKQKDQSQFTMFLIDFINQRINYRKREISLVTSPYAWRHHFYTKQVLINELVKSPNIFLKYFNDPFLPEMRCQEKSMFDEQWADFLKNCDEINPSSSFNKHLQFKIDYICNNGDKNEDTFTDQEKCKLLNFAPMFEERNIFKELTESTQYMSLLASEIIYSFLNEGDPYQQMTNYGPYFTEIVQDLNIDLYFEEIRKGFFGWQAQVDMSKERISKLYDSVFTVVLGPDHGYDINNLTFPSIMYLKQLYKSLQIEMTTKDNWMTSLTNLEDTRTIEPRYFLKDIGMAKYYYQQPNNPDKPKLLIENFKISDMGTFFKTFVPEKNVLNTFYAGKKYEDSIWEHTFSHKSSNCFRLRTNKNKTSSFYQEIPGDENALNAVIFTGYNGYSLTSINWGYYATSKFEISIDFPENISDNFLSDVTVSPIVIETNKLTKVALTQQRFIKSKQYRNCDDTTTKSYEACRQTCFVESVYKSEDCNCVPVFGMEFFVNMQNQQNTEQMLDPQLDVECTFEQLSNQNCYNFIQNWKTLNTIEIERLCKCKEPCTGTSYKTAIQSTQSGLTRMESEIAYGRDVDGLLRSDNKSQWLIDYYRGEGDKGGEWEEGGKALSFNSQRNYLLRSLKGYSMNKGLDYQNLEVDDRYLSQGVANLLIYYDTLDVESFIESEADKASSLISDLGGQLGLWLGISMVSLMEITVCFYSACWKRGVIFKREPVLDL